MGLEGIEAEMSRSRSRTRTPKCNCCAIATSPRLRARQRAQVGARSPLGVPPRLLPGSALPPELSSRPGFLGPGPDGVTRPFLSQSRDSTSRAGRSTGGHDARSRPGAAVTNRRPQGPHSLRQPASPDGVLLRARLVCPYTFVGKKTQCSHEALTKKPVPQLGALCFRNWGSRSSMPWIEVNVSFNSFFDRADANVRVRGCEAQFDKALQIAVFIAAADMPAGAFS